MHEIRRFSQVRTGRPAAQSNLDKSRLFQVVSLDLGAGIQTPLAVLHGNVPGRPDLTMPLQRRTDTGRSNSLG